MNPKRNPHYLLAGLLLLFAVACNSAKKQETLAYTCCQECLEAFSQSPVGVGAAGVQCGEFTTAAPLSEKCRNYFAGNPQSVADCQ